jgi:hypothetical protein
MTPLAMFAMFLVFTNQDDGSMRTSRVSLFENEQACQAALPSLLSFQQGKHDGEKVDIHGFCVPTIMMGGKST